MRLHGQLSERANLLAPTPQQGVYDPPSRVQMTTLRQDFWTVLRFRASITNRTGLQLASYALELSILTLILLNVVFAVSESTVAIASSEPGAHMQAAALLSRHATEGLTVHMLSQLRSLLSLVSRSTWTGMFLFTSTVIFSVEYVLRLWSCVEDERYRGAIAGRFALVTCLENVWMLSRLTCARADSGGSCSRSRYWTSSRSCRSTWRSASSSCTRVCSLARVAHHLTYILALVCTSQSHSVVHWRADPPKPPSTPRHRVPAPRALVQRDPERARCVWPQARRAPRRDVPHARDRAHVVDDDLLPREPSAAAEVLEHRRLRVVVDRDDHVARVRRHCASDERRSRLWRCTRALWHRALHDPWRCAWERLHRSHAREAAK